MPERTRKHHRASRVHRRLAVAAVAGIAVAGGLPAPAEAKRVEVRTSEQFAAAVKQFRKRGGVIVLRPGYYARLAVGPRAKKAGHLWIRARPGASAARVRLHRTRAVTIVGLRIAPRAYEARVDVIESRNVTLERIRVTAGRSRFAARVKLDASTGVRIRRSTFSRCGEAVTCILTGRSSRLRIVENTFFDCFGCDFIRGRFGSDVVIRLNRFDRALVGRCGRDPAVCNHQDHIQLQAGKGLLVERNHFGVYDMGAAQLYLSGPLSNVVVRNNIFLATDPRVPGLTARAGMVVGNPSGVMPRNVVIVANTILSGATRTDGVANSVLLSAAYANVPAGDRPVLANNVLALVDTPERLCPLAQALVHNVVEEGTACSETDVLGPAAFDRLGRPTPGSVLTIDQGHVD